MYEATLEVLAVLDVKGWILPVLNELGCSRQRHKDQELWPQTNNKIPIILQV